jgi:HK97 family phage prohead protease
MEADFKGWVTKAGVKCSDGRTIMANAFQHQDKARVPLVWQHGHTDPTNVLGHVILENRNEGVYGYGFFNNTDKAEHAHSLLEHDDIDSMSIWANELMERNGRVMHGTVREVSLVLSGANPGAKIESVTIRHSDGVDEPLEDEAIIYTGEGIEHEEPEPEPAVQHADANTDGGSNSDPTIQDIYDSMNDDQKQVLHYMVGEALAEAATNAEHSNVDDKDGEDNNVSRNVFENTGGSTATKAPVLSHSDFEEINAISKKEGSLKAALTEWGMQHGIENIEVLFPEATQLTAAPEFFARRQDWVNGVLQGRS